VPDVRIYQERRPYAVPDNLADLSGPAGGRVVLPHELGWTGRTRYDLDDPADAAVLYERILVDAVRTQDVTQLVNLNRLRLMWPRLFLPTQVRRLWESRFPELTTAATGPAPASVRALPPAPDVATAEPPAATARPAS
jgi:hypothetical protein